MARRLLGVCGLALGSLMLGGCEVDSFFDPSVVGRWENTPTIVPVLERIDVIERDTGQFVEYTKVLPEDLIPEPSDYRIQPGDGIVIEVDDFLPGGQPARYERLVDPRGFIDVPQIGRLSMTGKTRTEAEDFIAQAIRDTGILDNPFVSLQVPSQRQQTFGVFGRVANTGRYVIPKPDYRLLEAITDAGGIDETIPNVYIIRQVPLSDVVKSGVKGSAREVDPGVPESRPEQPTGEDLIDLIEELTAPPEGTSPPPTTTPGVVGMSALSSETPRAARRVGRSASASAVSSAQDGTPPAIDLVDDERVMPKPAEDSSAAANIGAGQWVFLNGEWVKVGLNPEAASGLPEGEDPLKGADAAANLMTQRVIEVPVKPLLQGVAQYNVVIRPGDVVSVPGTPTGIIYAMGPGIARAGTYQLPGTGQFTLMRLIASAGGLSAIGIPERTDITRIVGENRQATIRVDVRAIFEGTAPDIVLRPDDLVNFGTNFWATPAAIIRNGFRFSYGFGFLIDRNFGNDIFGAPPTNQFGQ